MSIKDYFYNKTTAVVNAATASTNVESKDYVVTKIMSDKLFTPHLDFASASNFAKFGSAYEYYTKSIERVYSDYPYDGSEKEKLLFKLSSSYLDEFIFDKKYPKTTGYINMSYGGWGTAASITDGYGLPNSVSDYEYIFVKGGMHAREGLANSKLKTIFEGSPVVYDSDKDRTTTFVLNMPEGFSVEFWLKKDAFDTAKTQKEVILDLWNGEGSSSADYGRFTLELSGTTSGEDVFRVTLYSGSTGFFSQPIGNATITTGSLSNWSHYAFTAVSGASGIASRLYKNGELNESKTLGSAGMGNIGGLINGYIGALQTSPSGSSAAQYAGKLSASLDEFRFWKTRRTSEQVYNNWYRPVGGGTNSDDANTKLGLYYKFNEGIVGVSSTDSIILDYSGRIANGNWTGYAAGSRNTGSAFVSSSFAYSEKEDPIIYSGHSRVQDLLSEMQESGSAWDNENPTLLYNTLPQWIRDEDEDTNENTKYLFQIIASYFDTLYSQISVMPYLKNVQYIDSKYKPKPFADRLIEDRGILVPKLFVNSDILEKYGNRDSNNILFEDDIVNVKNFIYTNIYNNLNFILKSKGTEKSIRNMLRCFGVDDEIVKLNLYTDGGIHYFSDKRKQTAIRKKMLNLNNRSRFSATVYQTSSANVSYTFVTGSNAEKLEKYSAMTSEINIEIPFKKDRRSPEYYNTRFLSSSIFGVHEPLDSTDYNDYTWKTSEVANFQVYLVRDKLESSTAKFVLKNQDGTLNLESSFFSEVYDGDLWTLAVRVLPENYPIAGGHLETANPTYYLEFYGVTHAFDTVESEFTLTASLSYDSGSSYLSNSKRFYVGAHRQNFTGSALERTDLKFANFRHYFDYLDNRVIKNHNLDITNYATGKGLESSTIFNNELSGTLIPSSDSIVLNWDFDNVTGSDSQGEFIVEDITSGSTESRYGWADNIVSREHRGAGYGFPATSTSFISRESTFINKKELPEISFTADNVYIDDEQRKYFIEDEDISDNFFSLEKSMNQVVSEEMLNMFSSVSEFNSLVGKATDRYRVGYKKVNFLRQLFFQKNSGSLDYERFTDYYKWIDSSVSFMVSQLFPISANHSDGVIEVIDSHILERNKYQSKFPLLTTYTATENALKGSRELSYNWKFGHAPISGEENENCLWQKERKERSDIAERETIRKIIINDNNVTSSISAKSDKTKYESRSYQDRRLAKPFVLNQNIHKTIHGGINYPLEKDREYIHNAVHRHGRTTSTGIPVNVLLVGEDTGQDIIGQQECNDVSDPNKKKTANVKVVVGKYSGAGIDPDPANDSEVYTYRTDISRLPLTIVSESVNTGYQAAVSSSYSDQYVFTNIHVDTTYLTNEVPMQGPFTQQWVGGHQSRHIDINKYDASLNDDDVGGAPPNNLHNQYTRAEAWRLLLAEREAYGPTPKDGAFGFTGFDYGGPYPDPARKGATLYRGERAKRPLNIENIKTTTGSYNHGNFSENYELVTAVGKQINNPYFIKNSTQSNFLPTSITGTLPETTHPMTLLAYGTGDGGNVFGTHSNNRQPDQLFVEGAAATSAFYAYGVSGSVDYQYTNQYPQDEHGVLLQSPFGIKVEIDTDSNPTFGDEIIDPASYGSSIAYWNALSSSLNANGTLNATYEVINPDSNYSKGIDCLNSGSAHAALSSSNFTAGDLSGEYTFSAWINMSTSSAGGNEKHIFNVRDMTSGESSARIFLTSGGDLWVYRNTISSINPYRVQLSGFEDNYSGSWVHLAITDGGNANAWGNVKIYVNAVSQSVTSETRSGAYATLRLTGSSFVMCRGDNGTNFSPFNGKFDEITYWKSSLSAGNVKHLYNAGIALNFTASNYGDYDGPNTLPETTNLFSWWSLDNLGSAPLDTGDIVTDVQGNCHLTVKDQYYDAMPSTRHQSFHPVDAIRKAKPMARFDLTASSNGSAFNITATSNIGTQFGFASSSVEGTSGLYYYPDASSSFSGSTYRDAIPFAGGIDDVQESRNLYTINDTLLAGTKNRTVISSRFSAPGGIEVQTKGYLDAYAHEYSVHNALPYRNLTVRGSGSGEVGTIRVNDQLEKREGLRTHLSRHSGKFGHDSQYGSVVSANYVTTPSLHKIQRNVARKPTDASTLLSPVFNEDHNNGFYQSPIPQSEFQYSWITGSLGNNYAIDSGKQRIYGYAPRDGEVSASYYGIVEALVFPTASEIFGE